MADYLIGYDIRDKTRLQRLHRKMLRFAVPIQYSVFLFTGTEDALKDCVNAVKTSLDERFDDLRCYKLPPNGFRVRLGVPVLPQGLFYSELPEGF